MKKETTAPAQPLKCPVCSSDNIRIDFDFPEMRCCNSCLADFHISGEVSMNPKDFKEAPAQPFDITPGEWKPLLDIKKPLARIVTENDHVVYSELAGSYTENDFKAICAAVNNTYKKGFNPEAMEGLYNALQNAVALLQFTEEKNLITGNGIAETDTRNGIRVCLQQSLSALKSAKL